MSWCHKYSVFKWVSIAPYYVSCINHLSGFEFTQFKYVTVAMQKEAASDCLWVHRMSSWSRSAVFVYVCVKHVCIMYINPFTLCMCVNVDGSHVWQCVCTKYYSSKSLKRDHFSDTFPMWRDVAWDPVLLVERQIAAAPLPIIPLSLSHCTRQVLHVITCILTCILFYG